MAEKVKQEDLELFKESLDLQSNPSLFALYRSYFMDLIDASQNGDIKISRYCNQCMIAIEDLLETRGIKLERV